MHTTKKMNAGILDQETLIMMNTPRCGMKDHSNSGHTLGHRIAKRYALQGNIINLFFTIIINSNHFHFFSYSLTHKLLFSLFSHHLFVSILNEMKKGNEREGYP